MTAEQRLGSVRSLISANMESYYRGLTQYLTPDKNVTNLKFLLLENFEIWKECLDPNNVIDNQELETWEVKLAQVMDI